MTKLPQKHPKPTQEPARQPAERDGNCSLHLESTLKSGAHDGVVQQIAFSPDGALLVSAAGDKKIKLWEVASGRLLIILPSGTADTVYPVFSPDGKHLATTGNFETQLYEIFGLKIQTFAAFHPNVIRAVSISANGESLACITAQANGDTRPRSGNGTVWDLSPRGDITDPKAADEEFKRTWNAKKGPVTAVALSENESLVASGTLGGYVEIRQVPGGELLCTLMTTKGHAPHNDSVDAMAFGLNDRLFVSASKDKTVRLWQRFRKKYREYATLRFPGGRIIWVDFAHDTNKLAILLQNETALRFWHLDRLGEELIERGIDGSRTNRTTASR